MSYRLLRRLLFSLPPEASHSLALTAMDAGRHLGLIGLLRHHPEAVSGTGVQLMGLNLPNPVGLAAGLDKNAEHIDALAALGFGFIEVGTLTPRPQPGNPAPRLFRLQQQQALINRMGFNNKGIDHALVCIKRSQYRGVLGINIGKNFDTPVENAVDDYVICMDKAYASASYLVVNLSSPNTPGLRSLQFGDGLRRLLETLKQRQSVLTTEHGRKVPLALKIAPDLNDEEIELIGNTVLACELEGVIATNTTLSRVGVESSLLAEEAGGLSGQPLTDMSTGVISRMRSVLGTDVVIIGVGGICSREDARQKVLAGADALQIYTGFIYQGPRLIADAIDGFVDARGTGGD